MAAAWMGTTYSDRQMRIQCNYCWNVRMGGGTNGMEGTVEHQQPMGPHKMVTTESERDNDPTRAGNTHAEHVARGPGQAGRGCRDHTSGTSSGTRELRVQRPNCTLTVRNNNTPLQVRLKRNATLPDDGTLMDLNVHGKHAKDDAKVILAYGGRNRSAEKWYENWS